MSRIGDFDFKTKKSAFERQGGLCAFCGVKLIPPWPEHLKLENCYSGQAHHLKPLCSGHIRATVDNCVYLCNYCHLLYGHGMSPAGIDKQGGSSHHWFLTSRNDFKYWKKT